VGGRDLAIIFWTEVLQVRYCMSFGGSQLGIKETEQVDIPPNEKFRAFSLKEEKGRDETHESKSITPTYKLLRKKLSPL